MAVTFSDLHADAGLKSLDEFLAGKSFISGDQLTKDDVKVYAAVVEKPGDAYPNASKWYESVSSALAASFPGKATGVKVSGQAAAAPAEAAVPTEGEDGDDDLDLFGDETEEEKKAAQERETSVKASAKKKERDMPQLLSPENNQLSLILYHSGGKSSVLLDVKPWDDETDMKKLEEAVRSVQLPGLLWGASKLVTVGYGIKKLQIMLTIVDDLVSIDDLIEEHLCAEPANEYIQSCDIVAFNKI